MVPMATPHAHGCAATRSWLPTWSTSRRPRSSAASCGPARLDQRRAALALADLVELPMRRAAHRPLLPRCWELRDTVTVYGAAYVALAELLDAPLVTADARLANAPGPRCRFELLGSPARAG
jgi:predicted nucleic acid-binding protein